MIRSIEAPDEEVILTSIVASFAKSNGQIEFKCYLVRQFSERMLQRHVRRLLETLDRLLQAKSKKNLLVLNLNVVKAACLLIEMLEILGNKFQSSASRCRQIRKRLIETVRTYMNQVDKEAEMKFLLLEKDFEHRDALDLITRYEVIEFLESPLAENVVRDIWRSQYAT